MVACVAFMVSSRESLNSPPPPNNKNILSRLDPDDLETRFEQQQSFRQKCQCSPNGTHSLYFVDGNYIFQHQGMGMCKRIGRLGEKVQVWSAVGDMPAKFVLEGANLIQYTDWGHRINRSEFEPRKLYIDFNQFRQDVINGDVRRIGVQYKNKAFLVTYNTGWTYLVSLESASLPESGKNYRDLLWSKDIVADILRGNIEIYRTDC